MKARVSFSTTTATRATSSAQGIDVSSISPLSILAPKIAEILKKNLFLWLQNHFGGFCDAIFAAHTSSCLRLSEGRATK